MTSADELFAQLEALAKRQYEGDEMGQLRCLVEMLKVKIRENDYRAERAREMLRKTMDGRISP